MANKALIKRIMKARAQLMTGDGWRIVQKHGYEQVILDAKDWRPFDRDQPLTD